MRAVTEFVRASVEERRRAGRLEFHDLLVLARDLLRDARPHGARRARTSATATLLLDEFQDTDPIQIELAVLHRVGDPTAGRRRVAECGRRRAACSSSATRSSRSTGSGGPTSSLFLARPRAASAPRRAR